MRTVARTIAERLEKSLDDSEKYLTLFSEKVSKADKMVNELYHKIENTPNVNAVEGFKMYKELRVALRYRRMVKKERDSIYELVQKIRKYQSFKKDVKFAHNQITNYHEKGWTEDDHISVTWGNDLITVQEMARSVDGINLDKVTDL